MNNLDLYSVELNGEFRGSLENVKKIGMSESTVNDGLLSKQGGFLSDGDLKEVKPEITSDVNTAPDPYSGIYEQAKEFMGDTPTPSLEVVPGTPLDPFASSMVEAPEIPVEPVTPPVEATVAMTGGAAGAAAGFEAGVATGGAAASMGFETEMATAGAVAGGEEMAVEPMTPVEEPMEVVPEVPTMPVEPVAPVEEPVEVVPEVPIMPVEPVEESTEAMPEVPTESETIPFNKEPIDKYIKESIELFKEGLYKIVDEIINERYMGTNQLGAEPVAPVEKPMEAVPEVPTVPVEPVVPVEEPMEAVPEVPTIPVEPEVPVEEPMEVVPEVPVEEPMVAMPEVPTVPVEPVAPVEEPMGPTLQVPTATYTPGNGYDYTSLFR